MGEYDIFSGLGDEDLKVFSSDIIENDPWRIGASGLGSIRFDRTGWSPAQSATTAFLQGLLAGGMGQYAREQEAAQVRKVSALLPYLSQMPDAVSAPEGVDQAAFETLKATAKVKAAQRSALLGELFGQQVQKAGLEALGERVKTRNEIQKDLITSPWKLQMLQKSSPSVLASIFGEQAGESPGAMKPASDAAAEIAEEPKKAGPNLLQPGRKSTHDKFKDYFQDSLMAGVDPTGARAEARLQIEGEQKNAARSFDDAKDAREKAQTLLDLAATAKRGMGLAGQTGSDVGKAYEKAISFLSPVLPGSQSEAKAQAEGDALLDSIKPKLVQAGRWPGALAVSEMETITRAGPSASNTPEQNAALVAQMEEMGRYLSDYADFVDAYREQNGTTAGAESLWMKYKQANPLYVDSGGQLTLNSKRPTWQEYFSGPAPTSAPSGISLPDLAKQFPNTPEGRAAFKKKVAELKGG